jgi:hypothetical protein
MRQVIKYPYLVQGQIYCEYENWGIDAQPGNWYPSGYDPNVKGFSISISTNVISTVNTQVLNNIFQLTYELASTVYWENDTSYEGYYGQPSTFDLQYYLNGYTNIVDQNNQPIPPSKLLFLFVNPNDTSQNLGSPITPDLSIEESVSLEAIPGTNGLVIQWPSYATNYQLETTTNLVNNSWATNSLPSPVQSGPFLQAIISTTNSCSFFRLIQMN